MRVASWRVFMMSRCAVLNLKQLQDGLKEYITHQGDRIVDSMAHTAVCQATVGLDIYKMGCEARFLEVLREDYAALCVLSGESIFHRWMRAYLAAQPIRSPYIATLSDGVVDFLETLPDVSAEKREMAHFERAVLRAWYKTIPPLLDETMLHQLDPTALQTLSFHVQPSLQQATYQYPVPVWWEQIVEEGMDDSASFEKAKLRATADAGSASKNAQHWAVWCAKGQCRYRRLSEAERIAWGVFKDGGTLVDLSERLVDCMDEAMIPEWIGNDLRVLIQDGWFSGLLANPVHSPCRR